MRRPNRVRVRASYARSTWRGWVRVTVMGTGGALDAIRQRARAQWRVASSITRCTLHRPFHVRVRARNARSARCGWVRVVIVGTGGATDALNARCRCRTTNHAPTARHGAMLTERSSVHHTGIRHVEVAPDMPDIVDSFNASGFKRSGNHTMWIVDATVRGEGSGLTHGNAFRRSNNVRVRPSGARCARRGWVRVSIVCSRHTTDARTRPGPCVGP